MIFTNLRKVLLTLTAVIVVPGCFFPSQASAASFDRFVCVKDTKGQFIIKTVLNDRTTLQDFARFNSKHFSISGFTPERRCTLVTQRLNASVASAIKRGSEKEVGLTTGKRNGYDVICTADSPESPCKTLIITLTPKKITGIDPDEALQSFVDSHTNQNGNNVFKEGTDGTSFFRLYPFYSK
jgi:Circadian oscillating protein COP23